MSAQILVVDDEPDIRLLLKDILEDEGYQVQLAEDAGAARQIKSSLLPDLILLDIWMPGVDGVSLLKEWNSSNQVDCPVVMMSGHGTVETAVEATRYGAVAFIEKPLSTAKLLNTLKTALAANDDQLPATASKPVEQPVGNSPVMQGLRQLAQNLKDNNQPVFITGMDAGSCRIWAEYLCHPADTLEPYKLSSSAGAMAPRSGNTYIEEISEFTAQQQLELLELLNHPSATNRYRIIAATRLPLTELQKHKNLDQSLVRHFEEAVFIPSLNEHIEDIPELLDYYVNWFSDRDQLPYRHFGVASQNLLRNFDWQGGVEQFKTFVKGMLSASNSEVVEEVEINRMLDEVRLNAADSGYNQMLDVQVNLNLGLKEAREIFEREYLSRHLELSGFNIAELARRVGQERTHLYRKLKSLGLPTKK